MKAAKKSSNTPLILIGVAALILFTQSDKEKPKTTTSVKSPTVDPQQFLKQIKPYAIALSNKIGVPYLFIMAQIALETGFGKSSLFTKYFNVGGIKAVKGQRSVELPTYEYIKGKKVRVLAKFAVYDNLAAGLVGYSGILRNRYFKKYTFKTKDAKQYVAMLQSGKPKYATDINYVPKIHKLIDVAAMANDHYQRTTQIGYLKAIKRVIQFAEAA